MKTYKSSVWLNGALISSFFDDGKQIFKFGSDILENLKKLEKCKFLTAFLLEIFKFLFIPKITDFLKNLLPNFDRGLYKLSSEPPGTLIGHHLTE